MSASIRCPLCGAEKISDHGFQPRDEAVCAVWMIIHARRAHQIDPEDIATIQKGQAL